VEIVLSQFINIKNEESCVTYSNKIKEIPIGTTISKSHSWSHGTHDYGQMCRKTYCTYGVLLNSWVVYEDALRYTLLLWDVFCMRNQRGSHLRGKQWMWTAHGYHAALHFLKLLASWLEASGQNNVTRQFNFVDQVHHHHGVLKLRLILCLLFRLVKKPLKWVHPSIINWTPQVTFLR